MKCSIVMSTRNKSPYLRRTLASIERQCPSFRMEVIVVDDGSTDDTREIVETCTLDKDVRYFRLENDTYRNPSVARNYGYRRASGDVVICQSDDVIHESADTIERLVNDLKPSGEFLIATVHNYEVATGRLKNFARGLSQYTGPVWERPFFFLGSLWRRDLYAAGGNDEEFTAPAFDDDWFADCLTRGLGLKPRFSADIRGLHQDHPRPIGLARMVRPSKLIYERKREAAARGDILWQASGGPWPFVKSRSLVDVISPADLAARESRP